MWYSWTENSGGTSYGNATTDAWLNNSIAVGCASAPNILGWCDYSEQTLNAIYGYNSTSFLVQNITYGLLLNYSQNGLSDNIQYTLYLNYESIPNDTNTYQTVTVGPIALPSGEIIDYSTPDIHGNISIPGNGGYVTGLTLETRRPFFEGGAFDIGFDYAFMYNATTQQSPLPVPPSYSLPLDQSYYYVLGFVAVIVVATLIIMKKKVA
jgi:hypothetical protein